MKMLNRLLIFFVTIVLLSIVACDDNYSDVFAEGAFRVSNDKLLFKPMAKSLTIQVGGAYEWEVDMEQTDDWCQVKPIYRYNGNDYAVVEVAENVGIVDRQTTFDLVSKFDRKTITISQLGSEVAILFNKDEVLYRGKTRSVIDLQILSNIEFTMHSDADWLKIETPYVDEETPVRLSVEENKTGKERVASVIFSQENGDYTTTLQVVQSADNIDYVQGDISKLEGNRKLVVVHATASSTAEKKGIELSYDGDFITHYQTAEWNKIDEPVVLEYHFNNEEALDYIVYSPYTRDVKKLFGQTEIWVKCVGKEYEKLLDHTFSGEQTQLVILPEKVMNPESVKFVVKSGSNKDDKEHLVVTCAEMEFYASKMHYPEIFTDRSYSKLHPDVTLDKIFTMEDEFFRTIAEYLYNGTYPLLRARNYEVYPNPNNSNYVTKAMSVLDNVTGISVAKNDTVVLMVEHLQGQHACLTVLVPGQNGLVQKDVVLTEGITKIPIDNDGLLYIKYFGSTTKSIFVHIAGGKVNGFYDTQLHTEQEGVSYLNKAEGKYFDLLGKYVHLIFPTAVLQENSSVLKKLVDKYDRIVELQRNFIGMPSGINNRICIMSVADLNIEEAANVVLLNETYISLYADPEKLCGDVLWEVGSSIARNLLPYGLSWNPSFKDLNAQYVLHEMEGVNWLMEKGYYESAVDRFIVKSENIENGIKFSDVDRIVPLWQLYLYMKEVRGDKDFFARLFATLSLKGSSQQTFVSEMNKLSKVDFKVFFKKWNFAKYNSAIQQVEKAPVVLEYLCESNVEMFKNPGTATASRCNYYEDVIFENGISRNVFVLEVVDAQNIVGCEVVVKGQFFMKLGMRFVINDYTNSTKVTAIGINGERIDLVCNKIVKL